jgi:8-oxo-dGTP pyrophosphatase MutT (NUDIX family)
LRNLAFFITGAAARLFHLLRAIAFPVSFGACAIVSDREGRVVLVRHSYRPGWYLPGGGAAPGEPPVDCIMRELREEIGLQHSDPPVLVGVFSRWYGWMTGVIVLYRVGGAEFDFKPSLEILELARIDPAEPPPGTGRGVRRRLAEFTGQAAQSPYW